VCGPFPIQHAASAAPRGGPGVEACGISPRDGDADPSYGGDAGATRLRTSAGAASRQTPLLRGHGGCSVTRGTGQGAAELRPNAGLGPGVWC
jgi:hypothetical protein